MSNSLENVPGEEQIVPETSPETNLTEAEKKETEPTEEQRREFITQLFFLVGESERFADNLPVDRRHLPNFVATMAYGLSAEKMRNFSEIMGDFSLSQAVPFIKGFTEELKGLYDKGDDPLESFISSFSNRNGISSEKLSPENFDRAKEQIRKRYLSQFPNLKAELETSVHIIKLLTGRELALPDFVTEDTLPGDLKNDEKVREYLSQVDQFVSDWCDDINQRYLGELNEEQKESFVGNLPGIRKLREMAANVLFHNVGNPHQEKISQFFESLPLEGKRVFELGGKAINLMAKNIGADAVNFDASGFDWNQWGKMSETTKIKNTMDSSNWRQIMDKIDPEHPDYEFDLTESRMVFDRGSGIEQTVKSRSYEEAAKELLKVLAETTKTGGYSMHQIGFTDGKIFGQDEEQILDQIGFEKVETIDGKVGYRESHHYGLLRPINDTIEEFNIADLLVKGIPDFDYPVVVLRRK